MVTHGYGLQKTLARTLVVLLALVAFASAARAEGNAVGRCQDLLPAFVKAPSRLDIQVEGTNLGQATGVRLTWPAPGGGPDQWIVCWYLPRHAESDAWQMTQLDTSKYGMLRRYDIQQLYKLLKIMEYKPQEFPANADSLQAQALYLLQQTINGISLGCVYALIAIGYTLVYGISRVINFAFGEIYMLAAFITVIAYVLAQTAGGSLGVAALLFVLFATAVVMAAYGWSMDKLVFQPLRGVRTTAPLIAALGLALALKDGVRLLQGPKTRYLLVDELTSFPLITGQGFDVYLSKGHVFIGLMTAAIGGALWWLHTRTGFGRCQRACAQDIHMAALVGVPINRTIALTFALGSALTGMAGVFAAAEYGVVNFHMGTLIGFKALTAALLGGIGSLPGAAVGGFIIALTECYTAAALGSEWKDIAVFAVLVLVLLFRPSGLLGTLATPPIGERP